MTEKTATAATKALKEDLESAVEKQQTLESRLAAVEKALADIKAHLRMG